MPSTNNQDPIMNVDPSEQTIDGGAQAQAEQSDDSPQQASAQEEEASGEGAVSVE